MGYELSDEDVETVETIFHGADEVEIAGQHDNSYGEGIHVEYDDTFMTVSIGDFTAALNEGYVVDNIGSGWFQLVPIDVDVLPAHQSN